jgi:hypothetical protein
MRRSSPYVVVGLLTVASSALAQRAAVRPIRLDSTTKFELVNGRILAVDYRGRRALKLAPLEGHEHDTDQEMAAVLTSTDFKDGVIEVDVAGARRAGYSKTVDSTGFKGIIGISFRVHGDSAERFYIRPENSRVSDQLYRNRSAQYESDPDFPWNRLRQERPGMYESYVDVESGGWTKLRIEVSGTKAKLFVNGATQPCLIVNDLRLGESHGKIALWARISSDAYFSNLRVEAK